MRAALAVLVLILATAAGTAYVSHAAAALGDDAMLMERVPSLALGGRSAFASPGQLSLIDQTYARVEDAYYRPVDLQRLLDGGRSGLENYLRVRGAKEHVAEMITTGTRAGDARLVRREVAMLAAREPSFPEADMTRAAISGMLRSLDDPYTVYLSAREISALNEELQGGDFGGIGVYIVQNPKTHETIVAPIPENPAIAAGVKPGDIILAVNGASTKGQSLDEVERRIRGPVGSRVTLLLRTEKGSAHPAITIVRARVHVPSAIDKYDRGIEYVRLSDFGTSSYDEVRKDLLKGKAEGAHGYILDLRANGGGLLEAAVQISSLFVPQGTVVATIDRNGDRDARSALRTSIGVAPLVVLVDRYTASAAEITAGAVQDYHVGTIVGTRTFGKGVVQSIYNLPDHSALKITTARYVTPLGRDINKKGITPDIVVSDPTANGQPDLRKFGTPADPVYAEARSLIEQKGA